MNAYEVARQAKEHGAQLFRERRSEPGQYDCKPYFSGKRSGWVIMDSFSGSAIVAVHDALNEQNRARFVQFSPQKMAAIAFKLVK